MPKSRNAQERMIRAAHSLQGLSCGDAFGERFFLHPEVARSLIAQRAVPSPPWHYTDDTAMAIAIAETLEELGEIQETSLAANFGRRYLADPQRGYGPAMHDLLPELANAPARWKEKSEVLFNGAGSFGNGSAMRVAPLGAYFADDLDAVFNQAEYSAVVTHSHPEAVAGAIAVAMAAALASQYHTAPLSPTEFLQRICQLTPMSEVHLGVVKALALPEDTTVETAVRALGNGSKVSAQDTVPFSLWAAAHHLGDYQAHCGQPSVASATVTQPARSSEESSQCPPVLRAFQRPGSKRVNRFPPGSSIKTPITASALARLSATIPSEASWENSFSELSSRSSSSS